MKKDFWPIPFPFVAGFLWLSLWEITRDVVYAHVSPWWLRVLINAATFIAMAAIAIYAIYFLDRCQRKKTGGGVLTEGANGESKEADSPGSPA